MSDKTAKELKKDLDKLNGLVDKLYLATSAAEARMVRSFNVYLKKRAKLRIYAARRRARARELDDVRQLERIVKEREKANQDVPF